MNRVTTEVQGLPPAEGKALLDALWRRLDAALDAGTIMTNGWDTEPLPWAWRGAGGWADAHGWREDPLLDGRLRLRATLASGQPLLGPDGTDGSAVGASVIHWGDRMPEPRAAFTKKRRRRPEGGR